MLGTVIVELLGAPDLGRQVFHASSGSKESVRTANRAASCMVQLRVRPQQRCQSLTRQRSKKFDVFSMKREASVKADVLRVASAE
mmetsp:Transcript_53164/g.142153  ORF Transcript_53164/g.142153 Transcript_53164/m.142153 type:complete len:85 (-) Transcript_53164:1889-2143(-)